MKKTDTLKTVWFMTAVYWIVGLLTMFWGKLDHILFYDLKETNNVYTLVLLSILLLPLFFSILVSLKVKLALIICRPLVAVIYLLVVIAAGMAYRLQDIIGYFFPIIIFVLMAILAIFYALVKTIRNKKNDKYYFIDDQDKIECNSFWDAYRQYYVMGLTEGIIESLLTMISN